MIASVTLASTAFSQESTETAGEHAARYTELVDQAFRDRNGPDEAKWSLRLDHERDDIRMAFNWILQYGSPDDALRYARSIGFFWQRSRVQEAREAAEKALSMDRGAAPTLLRAEVLHRAGVLAFRQGDAATARKRMESSLEIARGLGDRRATALALTGLAQVALRENPATVATYGNEAATLYRETGDRRGEGLPLHMMAEAARMMGDNRAEAMYERSLALHRELKDSGMIASELHNLAYVKLRARKSAAADSLFRESWGMFRRLGDDAIDAYILAGLASVAAVEEKGERAAQLFGASKALFDNLSSAPDPADKAEMDRYIELAKRRIGVAAFERGWERGHTMTRADAIALAGPAR
jgi:non-specific serine/threonine protein kinase